MITHITKDEVEAIIMSEYGIYLSLNPKGYFFLFQKRERNEIYWCDNPIMLDQSLSISKITSVGLMLCYYSEKEKGFIPQIIEVLHPEYPMIPITSLKVATEVTNHKEISMSVLEIFENKQVILTYKDRPIGFGMCQQSKFKPVIDVGWYLREGD